MVIAVVIFIITSGFKVLSRSWLLNFKFSIIH